ncbi:MAG: hypothetical protein AAB403_04115, partial [Planctomycetota bacterium]
VENLERADDAFVLRREAGRLLIEIPGAGSFEVFPESATRLFARALEWDALFVIDDHGNVTEVLTRNQGVESRWRKTH